MRLFLRTSHLCLETLRTSIHVNTVGKQPLFTTRVKKNTRTIETKCQYGETYLLHLFFDFICKVRQTAKIEIKHKLRGFLLQNRFLFLQNLRKIDEIVESFVSPKHFKWLFARFLREKSNSKVKDFTKRAQFPPFFNEQFNKTIREPINNMICHLHKFHLCVEKVLIMWTCFAFAPCV